MMDEIFDRSYQSAREDLNRGIDVAVHRLVETITVGLSALNRVQFDAPWRNAGKRTSRV